MRAKILALGISVVLSMLVVEGTLRLLYEVPPEWGEPQTRHLVDPQIGWILPSNDRSFTIDMPVSTNSNGLRDDEMTFVKPPGETRVLCLGDSFTFALGVGFDDLYVQKLERKLRVDHPERAFQVINAGVAGYNTTQELVFLLSDGLRYEPDLVTVGFYWNDLLGNEKPLPRIDGPIRRDVARPPESPTVDHKLPAWFRNRLRRNLVLYLGVTRVKALVAAFGPPENDLVGIQRSILAGDEEELESRWKATGERLRMLHAVAQERGIPILLVSFPMENQIRQRAPASAYDDALRAQWSSTGAPMIDLGPAFRTALEAGRNPYLAYDLHPGPIGMEITAEAILAEIERNAWLGLSR